MPEIPSKQYFDVLSSETGFSALTLEKAFRMLSLLNEISRLEASRHLALRGGTAINLSKKRIPRLSVDIDLVIFGVTSRPDMLSARAVINQHLFSIFRFQKYQVKLFKPYALDSFTLSYDNLSGNRDHTKVEINYVAMRIPLTRPVKTRINNPFRIRCSINTLATEELYASKIKALIERSTPRDLFDVYTFLKSDEKVDLSLLRKSVIFYSCLELKDDFRKVLQRGIRISISRQRFENDLRRLLSEGDVFDVVKASKWTTARLQRLLTPRKKEQRFMDEFYQGNYFPTLLFPGRTDLEFHPNVKRRLFSLKRVIR
ncbi:MAG: nucleotidyl transferase AbiEii/AbiGii toxin family protein [Thaumarchaeota archaeon]|nr:nucleotidyl transferase AbiEii/AbiGii toxin family protein [Nitrososphaerota archaeon]